MLVSAQASAPTEVGTIEGSGAILASEQMTTSGDMDMTNVQPITPQVNVIPRHLLHHRKSHYIHRWSLFPPLPSIPMPMRIVQRLPSVPWTVHTHLNGIGKYVNCDTPNSANFGCPSDAALTTLAPLISKPKPKTDGIGDGDVRHFSIGIFFW